MREQKEILGFEDNVGFPQEERKDSKRSEQATLHQQQHTIPPPEHDEAAGKPETTTVEAPHPDDNDDDDVAPMAERADDHPTEFSKTATTAQQLAEKEKQERASSNVQVLLTPQNRFIPTLPKVIITASASVSDGSGKKLNYSVGSVIGDTTKIRAPPSTYDEYKEDDVVLDPFFLDVPKINPRGKRDLKQLRPT